MLHSLGIRTRLWIRLVMYGLVMALLFPLWRLVSSESGITMNAGTEKDIPTASWAKPSPWKPASWRWRTSTTPWSANGFTRSP